MKSAMVRLFAADLGRRVQGTLWMGYCRSEHDRYGEGFDQWAVWRRCGFWRFICSVSFNNKGRKPTMSCGAVFFTIGAALQAVAVSMPMLYIPRLLSGAGIGMLAMCSPVCIAEIAPESHRGQLATLWQLAITSGIVLVSILNIWLAEWGEGWRISYGGNIVFSVALLCILTIMPEPPHFLVEKGRNEDAREALSKVRFEVQVAWELDELQMETLEVETRG